MASPPSPPPPSSPPPPPSSQPDLDNNDPPMATPLSLLIPATQSQSQSQPIVALPSSTSSRRLPPPCWTPDETSALIDSYRDKWYSLRRGNLRAAHWQDVAEDLHRRCPNAPLPKTAVQCRHKMEKLRKRYRAELQRAKSIPHHRFNSSWVYFPKMESMEKGPTNGGSANGGSAVSLSSPPVATVVAATESLNDVEDDDGDEDDDDEFRNYEPRREFNRDYLKNGLRIKIAGNSSSGGSGFRSKKGYGDFDENPNPNSGYGYRAKYGSVNNFSSTPPPPPQFDDGVRYGGARVLKNCSSNGSAGGSSGMNMNMNNVNSMMVMKKKKTGLGKRERESRGDEAAMEMVEAIRGLGEGFVRMEKMKIEIMRETERMRMEMEMKRTEMILESQHRIVEAFAKGWSDSMKMKKDASC